MPLEGDDLVDLYIKICLALVFSRCGASGLGRYVRRTSLHSPLQPTIQGLLARAILPSFSPDYAQYHRKKKHGETGNTTSKGKAAQGVASAGHGRVSTIPIMDSGPAPENAGILVDRRGSSEVSYSATENKTLTDFDNYRTPVCLTGPKSQKPDPP